MKGVGVLAPSVPAPANSALSSSDSEPEAASAAPMCHVPSSGERANPEEQSAPSDPGPSGSQEKDVEMS
jgi:hypothetical protein